MEFYHSILGGELTLSTFGEAGVPGVDPEGIMHAQLISELGYWIMASDSIEVMPVTAGDTIAMSLSGDDVKLRDYYAQLADGGTVVLPLERAPWGDEYGQVRDKFGVLWHVNVLGSPA